MVSRTSSIVAGICRVGTSRHNRRTDILKLCRRQVVCQGQNADICPCRRHVADMSPTSAAKYINGKFDYNKMPLAPMGCAVQVHVSPNRRLTWAAHSLDGWYLRTSDEHYRCHVVFVKKTRSKRISDTVYFQHKYITNPTITHEDKVVKALGDATQTLLKQKNI